MPYHTQAYTDADVWEVIARNPPVADWVMRHLPAPLPCLEHAIATVTAGGHGAYYMLPRVTLWLQMRARPGGGGGG